ncbi:hypothetical protein IEQ34_020541 [Dendrobium chrysotoxum]|uniref:Uncharacterized protein n=1 Tax=Dendrobium chrysotoxum TaxID=161865 RepID=A0AAV7FKM1_DENCH|nr:hypothetical protein IEQ34_020541 [Dendrobium chrysotoxum]
MNNYFMKLTKWSQFLDVGVESPGFLSQSETSFFSPHILHALGSMFGRPLKVDNATSVGSRPSLARVLVELDIAKNFPKQSWLGLEKSGYIQKV